MRLLKIGIVLAAFFVVASTVWVVRQEKAVETALPVYGALESFQLVNQSNAVFDSSSLLGHVSVINFIFTSCPQVCPILTRQMARIQERTKALGKEVQLVSISVDPERDKPAELLRYGKKYGADFSRWVFLTGPIEVLRRVVVKGFMNAMGEGKEPGKPEPDLFEITHGENFVVLDKRGNIRAFRHAKNDRDIYGILRVVNQLVKEPGKLTERGSPAFGGETVWVKLDESEKAGFGVGQ